ncbi:MAG: prolyl oligopeptidase family serine peptidase [Verrucomicrobiales bacterium]
MKVFLLMIGLWCAQVMAGEARQEAPKRAFPKVGDQITEEQRTELARGLAEAEAAFAQLPHHPQNANAEIFLKAIRYALDYTEFYKKGDVADARKLLVEARARIAALKEGEFPWLKQSGYVVRGYYSEVDGAALPFGLEIPEALAGKKKVPAWMWLQGRGETRTDLHFIAKRMKASEKFQLENEVIIHPWGRYCVGTKNAGEVDVLAVRRLLVEEELIDPDRLVLAGFSMGGGGAWMIGAHHTDLWTMVHAGAGYVEVREFTNLSDEAVAALPWYEKLLWGQNDVPDYARNLLNVPVVAYSGEIDGQREAAEIMERVLKREGLELKHFIGPGAKHVYEEKTQGELVAWIREKVAEVPTGDPLTVSFQTKTLAYPGLYWLHVTGLDEHWQDSRVDAALSAPIPEAQKVTLTTKNVRSLTLRSRTGEKFPAGIIVEIDGQKLPAASGGASLDLVKTAQGWSFGAPAETLRKKPGLQGPIDDAFTDSFLYVMPDGKCATDAVAEWVAVESAYQIDRWRYLMRGDVRVKKASEVTAEDIAKHHLILWGDPSGNSLLAKVLPDLPLSWSEEKIALGKASHEAGQAVCAMVYPNPLNPEKYLVLNSGLTFREDEKNNSLQNPHLPDWALIDLSVPLNGKLPGRVIAADFFDESWQVR